MDLTIRELLELFEQYNQTIGTGELPRIRIFTDGSGSLDNIEEERYFEFHDPEELKTYLVNQLVHGEL